MGNLFSQSAQLHFHKYMHHIIDHETNAGKILVYTNANFIEQISRILHRVTCHKNARPAPYKTLYINYRIYCYEYYEKLMV